MALAAPDYDSGWVALAEGGSTVLSHSLGSDLDDYVVELQQRHRDGHIHNSGLGQIGPGRFSDVAHFGALTATQITLVRGTTGSSHNLGSSDELRVRIWLTL